MEESILYLKEELQKFTSFSYPENIRSLANDAVSFLGRKVLPVLPVSDPDASVVRMISTIFMNPKLANSSPNLVTTVLSCITTNIFSLHALDKILKGLVKIASDLDCEAAVTLLQKAPSQIINNFPHLTLIKITLSFVITMMAHNKEEISSASFASFPQILENLVNSISNTKISINNNKDDEKNNENNEFIQTYIENCSISKYIQQFEKFDNPFFFILYLIFNDLTAIALKQPLQWLLVDNQPFAVIYDVLELILSSYSELIQSEPQLLCTFEGAIIQSMTDTNALQFIICFIDTYLESHCSLCNALFEEYLSRISQRNANRQHNQASLFFFRSIATREKNFASRFFLACDEDNSLFLKLFKSIMIYTEQIDTKDHFTYSLVNVRWSRIQSEKVAQRFNAVAPFEIVFGIIDSFVNPYSNSNFKENNSNFKENNSNFKENNSNFKENNSNFKENNSNSKDNDDNNNSNNHELNYNNNNNNDNHNDLNNYITEIRFDERLGIFVSTAFEYILKISLTAMKFASLETFDFPFNLLSNSLKLLRLTNMHNFSSIFDTVCDLKIDENIPSDKFSMYQIFDKTGLYTKFLANFAEENPAVCSGKWTKILRSLFNSSTSLKLDFATTFSDDELKSITKSAISINPLPFNFITNLIIANSSRFDLVWSILEPFLINSLENVEIEFDELVLTLILEMINRAINDSSEDSLMKIIYTYISSDKLFFEYKESILTQLRQFLAENTDVIKRSWIGLFKVLSPKNFATESDLHHLSFNILTLLSNNHIQLIPKDALTNYIDLIISFGDCNDNDINLSLSSFDLLWNVVRIIGNDINYWQHLMGEVLRLIHDERSDISQCAIRTFFSLMSSNFETIPNSVIEYFVASGFTKILDGFNIENERVAGSFELALQELAHYSSSFWTSFDKNESFHTSFLPQLIEKATNFCTSIKNNEIITNTFQFYQTLFECEHLDPETSEKLQHSIEKMADVYLKIQDQNNIIFSCYGRMVNRILLTLKTRSTLETLPAWFPLIRRCVTKLHAEGFVHITPQRILDIIPSLFPMDDNTSIQVIELLNSFLSIKQENHEKTDQNREKTDQNHEKADQNHEKADQNHEKADQNHEKADQNHGKTDQNHENEEQIYIQQEKSEQQQKTAEFEPSKSLQEFLFQLLSQIFTTELSDYIRLKFMMICKTLGKNDFSEALSKLIVDSCSTIIANIDNESAPDVFECLTTISDRWPSLQVNAKTAIVKVLDKGDKETQLLFIEKNKAEVNILLLIWSTYFDTHSDGFNKQVYDNCFDSLLEAIGSLLSNSKNQLKVLNFLITANSPAKSVRGSKESEKAHLLRLMKPLTALITQKKGEIRAKVQKIFEIISEIVTSML